MSNLEWVIGLFTALGLFIAFKNLIIARDQKIQGYRRQIQFLFQDLFELNKKVGDDLTSFKRKLTAYKFSSNVNFFQVQDTYQLVVELSKLQDEDLKGFPELLHLVEGISNLHYYNQNIRNILLYKIEVFFSSHSKVLNNYETFMCFHNLIIFQDARIPIHKYYCQAIEFYDYMRKNEDAQNCLRMGITLTGFEIDEYELERAENRIPQLYEILCSAEINNSEFIRKKIEYQELRLMKAKEEQEKKGHLPEC